MPDIHQDLIQQMQADENTQQVVEAQRKSKDAAGKTGAVGVLLAVLWKAKAAILLGLGKLKFVLGAAKLLSFGKLFATGGSMLVSLLFYASIWGLPYAAGFVLLIFVHEMGHVLALRFYGVSASVPIFIPFMGAFVALKEMPKNVKIEAIVAIAGPITGTAGAVVCQQVYGWTGNSLWLALAYAGYFINLFNLMPVLPLDGGRVVGAISPWLWVAGLIMCVGFLIMHPSIFLIILVALSLPRFWSMWRQTDAQREYYQVPPGDRTWIGIAYFGLAAFLGVAMTETHDLLQHARHGWS